MVVKKLQKHKHLFPEWVLRLVQSSRQYDAGNMRQKSVVKLIILNCYGGKVNCK